MNKCLSLVHLTSTIGRESSGSDESTSRLPALAAAGLLTGVARRRVVS